MPNFVSHPLQMRLPALVVANALLTGFSYSLVSVCTREGFRLRLTLVPRMCAACVGLMTDAARRYLFLSQHSE
jgi:hypothetical protein